MLIAAKDVAIMVVCVKPLIGRNPYRAAILQHVGDVESFQLFYDGVDSLLYNLAAIAR